MPFAPSAVAPKPGEPNPAEDSHRCQGGGEPIEGWPLLGPQNPDVGWAPPGGHAAQLGGPGTEAVGGQGDAPGGGGGGGDQPGGGVGQGGAAGVP